MQSGVYLSVGRFELCRPVVRRWWRAALISSGFVVLALVAVVSSQRSVVAHPRAAGGAAALGRLELLPLQAQSVVSNAVGSGAAAFAAERRQGGYGLAGGGVAADLNRRAVAVRVNGGTLLLAVSGVGRGVRLVAPGRVSPIADTNRVVYRRARVREWYAAGPLGIEQGFAVTRRPAGTTGPLTLAVRLGGSLRAHLVGSQVVFLASSGGVRARYGGLTAVDARGRRLPATLALHGRRLLLRVDDRGARYPVRIDPLIQQGPKLTASDEAGSGAFGESVALSADGNIALIGAASDNSSVGAAWVFTRSGGTWIQQGPKLTADDEIGGGQFGISVALSADGSTALIGGSNDNLNVGAAWVFTRSGSTWTQQGPKLAANDEFRNGIFGDSVALSADGNTALIGGRLDSKGGGAAWVFTRWGTTWSQQGPALRPHDAGGDTSFFGFSVALAADGNTALIGGPGDVPVGAAWLFTRSGTTWSQLGPKLTASDATPGGGGFGSSVALSGNGNTALIGGASDNNDAGAAWVFTNSGTTWIQQGPKLTASDETAFGQLGSAVALSGDGNTALIGGPGDVPVGAAWLFIRSGGTWSQPGPKLTASDETGSGGFGSSVALSSDANTALIGAAGDNSGVGAAWVFGVLLIGSPQIQPNVDTNPAGTAEAFRYTAVGTGSAGQLSVYLDSTNAAKNVIVGVYTNTSAGNPGALLTSGSIMNPINGGWNPVTIPATLLSAGTRYWLAVLAPRKAGKIEFRDLPDGTGGPNQTSAQTSLTSMPGTWKTGTRYANSPASLFAAP